jgi:saccharopine dehydrogenase (NAD+, L-lysine-forming)
MPAVFSEIMMASRTRSKCDAVAADVKRRQGVDIATAQVDADNTKDVVRLIKAFEPELLIHVALPYQDLALMDACLETGVHYLDTANYEPKDKAAFEYSWQWAYHERFKAAGLTAILGCGFDPGVSGIFTAYAAKHYFDEIHYLDIVDCNAGDHGHAFATNFNPEINIREITQKGRFWENGAWHETEPLSIHKPIDYPQVGPKESYLLYHEELESLVKNFPTLKRARFWMTFSQNYIKHLEVLQNVGMTRIDPVRYQGVDIVPLQFLKAVLPEPSSLGVNYHGQTSIGCQLKGIRNGRDKTLFIYNNCDHAETFREVGAQAISYTTGVPAMIGAQMLLKGLWKQPGVYNVESFDPDPFMEELNQRGLPWQIQEDIALPHDYND